MWEYKVVDIGMIKDYDYNISEKELDYYGENNWELVSVYESEVIFKRRKFQ